MANCGDLERNLRDMNRRIGDIERRLGGSGGGGGAPNNLDEERIIRKAVERVFKHPNWIAVTECLAVIIKGRVG